MYNNYAQVIDGEIKAVNVKRGGTFKGKRLGKLSPDTTYATMDLYPIIGSKPVTTESQTVTGPTYTWDSFSQVVNKVYTITEISEDILLQSNITAKLKMLKADFESYMFGHYGYVTQMTILKASTDISTDAVTKARAKEVGDWVTLAQTEYLIKKAAIAGGDLDATWDFSTFDDIKPEWDFENFVLGV